jgi:murein DD-endopeptidase MepM/ murein hydrolase activator NlpD
MAGFSLHYYSMWGRLSDLSILEEERILQQAKIQEFSFTIEGLERQMARLMEMDRKVRKMTNLPEAFPPDREEMPGIGGPESPWAEATQTAHSTNLMAVMENELKMLSVNASRQERSLETLASLIQDGKFAGGGTPAIWPTHGRFTSGFGSRISPFPGHRAMHDGLDIAAPRGTPVVATAAGTVSAVGYERGLGNAVRIDHHNGIRTIYGHLSRSVVQRGQIIRRGGTLGFVGNTGLSTGSHLHYEISVNGAPVNPMRYILDGKATS